MNYLLGLLIQYIAFVFIYAICLLTVMNCIYIIIRCRRGNMVDRNVTDGCGGGNGV